MCFDTATSKTDRHKRVCVILEQLLGQDLLHSENIGMGGI